MIYGWEGNRRSGVELAIHQKLQWFIHLRAQRLSYGDEHPTNTHHKVMSLFTFILPVKRESFDFVADDILSLIIYYKFLKSTHVS